MNIKTSNVDFVSYPTTEWIVDFETGNDSTPQSALEAVAQDIYIALNTPRYKHPIMGSNFGITLDDLVGLDYEFVQPELERRIKDALSIDDRIYDVTDFKYTMLPDSGMLCECLVRTSFGTVPVSLTIGEQ